MERKRRAAAGLGPIFPDSCTCERCGGSGAAECHQCGGTGVNTADKAAELFQNERNVIIQVGEVSTEREMCGQVGGWKVRGRRQMQPLMRCTCPSAQLASPVLLHFESYSGTGWRTTAGSSNLMPHAGCAVGARRWAAQTAAAAACAAAPGLWPTERLPRQQHCSPCQSTCYSRDCYCLLGSYIDSHLHCNFCETTGLQPALALQSLPSSTRSCCPSSCPASS